MIPRSLSTPPALRVVRTVVLAVAVLVLVVSPAGGPAEAKKKRAEPIPADLELTTLDGAALTFGDLRGKAVLLDFWATWCKPCRQASPTLRRLHARLHDKPFEMVGISVDHDREGLEAYVEEEGLEWPQVWDRGGRLAHAFGVRSFPHYLILDHEGRPVGTLSGWSGRHGMALSREVGRAVKRARKAAERAARASDGR